MDSIHQARLAQSVEHQTLNRRVVGSSPTVDKNFFILYFVASDALLAGRLAPCKWNQAWRPSELYMCIEREKVDFKTREVNCLKECALALSSIVSRIDIRSTTIHQLNYNINIEILLKGCPLYDDRVNGEIFAAVHNFIQNSQRFDWLS